MDYFLFCFISFFTQRCSGTWRRSPASTATRSSTTSGSRGSRQRKGGSSSNSNSNNNSGNRTGNLIRYNIKKKSFYLEVPPRLELGSLDSKSNVFTITLWDLTTFSPLRDPYLTLPWRPLRHQGRCRWDRSSRWRRMPFTTTCTTR